MKILKWPILYILLQLFIIIVWGVSHGNLETFDLNIYFPYAIAIIAIVFIPLLIKDYKHKDSKVNKGSIIEAIIYGIIISILYNTFIYHLNKVVPFTNLYEGDVKVFFSIISTGLVGPIIEELMFRGIIYNDLKQKHSNMFSIMLTTALFALLHFNIVQSTYAVILGFMLIYSYEKSNNIKVPIAMHISANLTTTFFVYILRGENIFLTMTFFIVALIVLCYLYKDLFKFRQKLQEN